MKKMILRGSTGWGGIIALAIAARFATGCATAPPAVDKVANPLAQATTGTATDEPTTTMPYAWAWAPPTFPPAPPAPTDRINELVQGSPWTLTLAEIDSTLRLELVFTFKEKLRVFMQNARTPWGTYTPRHEMKFVKMDDGGTVTFSTYGGGEYEIPPRGNPIYTGPVSSWGSGSRRRDRRAHV